MNEDFYLTLLSNSSMKFYPDNKTTSFTTELSRVIKLEGEWVVALVEFQYPCSILTVNESENIVYLKIKNDENDNTGTWHKTSIETGNYQNVEDLTASLNSRPLLKDNMQFIFNSIVQRVYVTIKNQSILSVKSSSKLALQLGFPPDNDFFKNKNSVHPANVMLGIPSHFFVYCDIVEPQMVGDVVTPLLRIVNSDPRTYTYGAHKMKIFSPPHYIPILRREFSNILIDIRNELGSSIPFQYGTLTAKLHFKRIR